MELEHIMEKDAPWRPELCRIWERSVDLEAQPLKRFGLFRGCGFGPAVRGIVGFGHDYISRMFS